METLSNVLNTNGYVLTSILHNVFVQCSHSLKINIYIIFLAYFVPAIFYSLSIIIIKQLVALTVNQIKFVSFKTIEKKICLNLVLKTYW